LAVLVLQAAEFAEDFAVLALGRKGSRESVSIPKMGNAARTVRCPNRRSAR
jgi:hypothetical protein